MPNCKQCNVGFEITDKDREFYTKMDVPEPKLCPACRQQRRLAWANQINLYKRKCDATGRDIVSHYHPDSPVKVYAVDYWISDKFDAIKYGRTFDFNRPFFEQWHKLLIEVPKLSLFGAVQFNENSEYVNYAGYNKDCYMIFDSDYNRDCYYSLGLNKSKSSVDLLRSKECELCYECIDCYRSYRLFYSQDCTNCSDSAFLKNCIGVKNSFMCSNLKNKEYFIFNKKYDRATFEKLMFSLSNHAELIKYFNDWYQFKILYPQRATHGFLNENVLGDYLVQCKDVDYCFDSMELWNCKYFCRSFGSAKDCMDCDECGDGVELLYENAISGFGLQNSRFGIFSVNQSADLDYCYSCFFSKNCFGCVGLSRKQYCILNKQYTKQEYDELVPRIIGHMKKTSGITGQAGEWGEFFPVEYSDMAYNETVAQEYYPLTKEEVLKRGWKWRDKDAKEYQPATAQVPNNSREADSSLCKGLLACEACGRNYKIVDQELRFYQTQGVIIPKKCFYCRHGNRFNLRNARRLFDRHCDNCDIAIKTTYSPDRPEKVFCEPCYQQSLV